MIELCCINEDIRIKERINGRCTKTKEMTEEEHYEFKLSAVWSKLKEKNEGARKLEQEVSEELTKKRGKNHGEQ